MDEFINASLFLFVLLNPFLMSVMLIDLLRELSRGRFLRVLVRASLISGAVFSAFAVGGERLFDEVLQVEFEAFLVFGGIIFLLVGLRMVTGGTDALRELRGPAEHMEGSVAMPFMIGPGTVSASVLAGSRLSAELSVLAVIAALAATIIGLMILKLVHDAVERTRANLIDRYVEIVGRISALFVGTVAVEMIAKGVRAWLEG
ncbi:MarC family protein [Haliangium sp.]|uniref:MarC family protein n=1 Tax=Haliangium sp. TaxID=2663208 RepID=UPI003D0F2201